MPQAHLLTPRWASINYEPTGSHSQRNPRGALRISEAASAERNINKLMLRGDNPGPPLLLEGSDPSTAVPTSNSTASGNITSDRNIILPVTFFIAVFATFIVLASFVAFIAIRRAQSTNRDHSPRIYELESSAYRLGQISTRLEREYNCHLHGDAVFEKAADNTDALRFEAAKRARGLRKGSTSKSSHPPLLAPAILPKSTIIDCSYVDFERLPSMDREIPLPPPIYRVDDPLQEGASGRQPEKLPSYR